MPSFSESTKHYNIYKNTYWGAFKTENETDKNGLNEIINNRNDFINKYYILKHVSKYPQYLINYIHYLNNDYKHNHGLRTDHIEIYTTYDRKFLIVNSPYGISEDEEIKFSNDGWTKIYNLYCSSAVTFIKEVDKESIKKVLKEKNVPRY
jgi:hypothetical protein